ncbi:MAG: hypothetical protein NZZ41_02045 [Candidatus Dojkabacteria bacterium]|nr:hypothetical protein [Candidatus Dojkabacteria bacterium]
MEKSFKSKNEKNYNFVIEKCHHVYSNLKNEDLFFKKISTLENKEYFDKLLLIIFFNYGEFGEIITDIFYKCFIFKTQEKNHCLEKDSNILEEKFSIFNKKTDLLSFLLTENGYNCFSKFYKFYELDYFITSKRNEEISIEVISNMISILQKPIIHFYKNKKLYVMDENFYLLSKIYDISGNSSFIHIIISL